MASNEKTWVSATWASVAGAFAAFLLLFLTALPVGNNFDHDRYFTAELILPGLVLLLATIAIQRWISPRALACAFMIFEISMLFLYSSITIAFTTWNGDNVMYIVGYMVVYHEQVFSLTLGGMPPLLYLVSLQRLRDVKQAAPPAGELLLAIMGDFAWATALATAILLLAGQASPGGSMAVAAAAIGISPVADHLRARGRERAAVQVPSSMERPLQSSSPSQPVPQSSSRVKNLFTCLIFLFTSLGIGYLWPDRFIHVADPPTFSTMNPREVLGDSTLALVVFEVTLVLCLTLFKNVLAKLDKVANPERVFGACIIVVFSISWVFMLVGRPVLPISITTAMFPWLCLFQWAWLAAFVHRRRRDSPGVIGGLSMAMTTSTWLGLVLSSDTELDGILYIMSGIAIAIAVFIILIVAVINPYFVNGKQDPVAPAQRDWHVREGSMEARLLNRLGEHHVVIAAAVIAALVATPLVMVGTTATSSSNFQILANLDCNCIFYLTDPMTRIDRAYMPNLGLSLYDAPNATIRISAAKNEYEPVQVVMRPLNEKHYSIYGISFSGFTHDVLPATTISSSNFKAYRVEYVESLSDIVPDMLVDFSPFAVADGLNHPLWLQFHVPINATEGEYTGQVTLTVDNKTSDPNGWNFDLIQLKLDIKLRVFNFTLPAVPTIKSNFGYSGSTGFDAMMQVFKEHRMMYWADTNFPRCTLHANGTVASIDTTALDTYVNTMHGFGTRTFDLYTFSLNGATVLPAGTFTVSGADYTASNYTAAPEYNSTMCSYMQVLEAYLKSQTYTDWFGNTKSWYDEFYLAGYDEVDAKGDAALAEALRVYRWIKNVVNATLPIMQTMGGNDELAQAIDIPCFHGTGHEPDFIGRFRSRFKQVWLYTTAGPRFPIPTISTASFATQPRALAWQCFIWNYTNYLIWDVVTPVNAGSGYAYAGWNGGSLFYTAPGAPNGYAPSTRLEMIREGFEDYEYFYLLAHRAPGNSLNDKVAALMSGFAPTMDYRAFQQLRAEIGAFLST